jgi:hypothetical protein
LKKEQEEEDTEQVLRKMLKEKDLSRMTPIEALNLLYEMKEKI